MQEQKDPLDRMLAGDVRPEDPPADRQMAAVMRRAIDGAMDADISPEILERERQVGLAWARTHWARRAAQPDDGDGAAEKSWFEKLRDTLKGGGLRLSPSFGGGLRLSPSFGAAFALFAVVGVAALVSMDAERQEHEESLTRGGRMTVLRLEAEDPGAKALEIVAALSGATISATLQTSGSLRIVEIREVPAGVLPPILKQYGLAETATPPMQIVVSPKQ